MIGVCMFFVSSREDVALIINTSDNHCFILHWFDERREQQECTNIGSVSSLSVDRRTKQKQRCIFNSAILT